jgi:WD40 repeat protein
MSDIHVQATPLCSLVDDAVTAQPAAHGAGVLVCSFRPAGPGSRNTSLSLILASSCADGHVKLWDCDSGSLLHSLHKHADAAYGCDWSPDGKLLATGSMDGKVLIWDVESGSPVWQHNVGAKVFQVTWNPDGYRLAVAALSGPRVMDLRK